MKHLLLTLMLAAAAMTAEAQNPPAAVVVRGAVDQAAADTPDRENYGGMAILNIYQPPAITGRVLVTVSFAYGDGTTTDHHMVLDAAKTRKPWNRLYVGIGPRPLSTQSPITATAASVATGAAIPVTVLK